MSKTLSGIVQTVVGIGLEFVPGLQAVGTSLIISGLTTAVSALLTNTPKPPATETAIKNPTPARVSGYGEGRHYMAFMLYVTDKDGYAIDVGAFHDGQIDSITGYYLADQKVAVIGGAVQKGDGIQFGQYSDIVQVGTTLGETPSTAFSAVISHVPDQWTANHRGDGIVTGYVISKPVKAKDYQAVYPTGGPNNMPLSLVMKRQLVFDWRDTTQSVTDPATWRYSENAVLHLAHYLLVRDNKDWATHFAPTLAYWTAAANDADIAVPLKGVQAVMTAKVDHGSNHLTLSTVNGLAVGMTITISATGNTSLSETRTVTDIAGLVVGLSSSLSNDHPLGSQVSWASTSGAPATEPRYRSRFAHQHTDAHKDVINGILACFDGWLSPRSDGALVVYSGRYYAPTVTIGPDQIVSYSIQDGIEEESAINHIAITYVSANHAYSVVDTDAWENTDDIAARGKVLSDNLANQVPSHSQARRLAKRKMAQLSAPKRGTCTTNAAGRIALGQRYVRLQAIDAGTTFLDAVVEIVAPVKRNLQTGGITFNWLLADPNVDAWNPATEEGLPAPVGNRIAPAALAAPTITSATPNYGTDSSSGAFGVFIDLMVTGPNREDLTWYARTRRAGSITWGERQYSDLAPGTSVEIATEFVPVDAFVEVEVAYSIGDGSLSPYSGITTVSTSSTGILTEDGQALTDEDGKTITSE